MRYSKEQIAYLGTLNGLSRDEISRRFNEKFGLNKSGDTLVNTAKVYFKGFKCSKRFYNDYELEFIKENRTKMNLYELSAALEEKFGIKRSPNSIRLIATRNFGLTRDTKFEKGLKSWHKGMSVEEYKSHYTNESFLRGKFKRNVSSMAKKYSIGDEVVRQVDGRDYIWIKVSEDPTIRSRDQWMLKQRYIWEQNYGKIPDGYVVMFLDQNCHNFNLDNLVCVPSTYVIRAAREKILGEEPIFNLAALKYCELKSLVEKAKKSK